MAPNSGEPEIEKRCSDEIHLLTGGWLNHFINSCMSYDVLSVTIGSSVHLMSGDFVIEAHRNDVERERLRLQPEGCRL